MLEARARAGLYDLDECVAPQVSGFFIMNTHNTVTTHKRTTVKRIQVKEMRHMEAEDSSLSFPQDTEGYRSKSPNQEFPNLPGQTAAGVIEASSRSRSR